MKGNDVVPPDGIDLPELPPSWRWVYLDELLTRIEAGKNFRCEERPPTESEYGIVKISAVTWGTYDEEESKTITNNQRVNLEHIIRPGDFLFSRANTIELVGACLIVRDTCRKLLLSDKILRLHFVCGSKNWINWVLKSRLGRTQIEALSTGNQQSMRNIGQERIKRICVPLPPVNEQRRIVAKIEELLSEMDKGIEALTTAREQLKAYRQSVLKQAFEGKLTEKWRKRTMAAEQSASVLLDRIKDARDTYYAEEIRQWNADMREWESGGKVGRRPSKPEKPAGVVPVNVEDVLGLPTLPKSWAYVRLATLAQIGSGMSVSKERAVAHPVEVSYLRVANVQRGALDLTHVTKMRVEKSQLSQLRLKRCDVLFNEGGDRDKLGRGWVWAGQIDPCITQNHVFRASPYMATELHAKFISYWGNTYGQKYFNTEGKQTTNLASINKTVLSAFPVPLPPMEEQCEIVREVEALLSDSDQLASDIQTQIAASIALRQSILKRAFSGQLVPQDPKDEPASALLERIRAEGERTDMEKSSKTKNGKSRKKNAA